MSYLSSIKRFVASRFPRLYDTAHALYALSNAASRASMGADKDALGHLRQQLGDSFTETVRDRPNKTVLFFSLGNINAILLEVPVIAAFQKAGYNPIIIASRDIHLRRAYGLLGLNISSHDFYYKPVDPIRIERVLKNTSSLKSLITIIDDVVRVGKFAASSILRTTRRGSINFTNGADLALCRNALGRSLASSDAAKRMFDQHKPSALVLTDPGYTPYGEAQDVAISRSIPVFTFNSAYRPGELVLKRYSSENIGAHFLELSKNTWSNLCRISWLETKWHHLEQDFIESYTGGSWFAEVGTQFDVENQDRQELIETLPLHSEKKTVVIFAHIFWDATFFYGKDLFESYEEWLCETLLSAAKNDHVNWIIKVHPANVVKDHRDGASGEHGEMLAIKRTLGELPSHIKVLAADTSIGTLSLFSIMDYCVTVRGTIGIEAACRGIRVLTAGTGRYDGYGFTTDFDSRDEFLRAIECIEEVTPMTGGETELAQRYAYGVFKTRSIPLSSVGFGFKRDSKAQMETWVNVKNSDELMNGQDVSAIAEWIASGEEDCCHWQNDERIG